MWWGSSECENSHDVLLAFFACFSAGIVSLFHFQFSASQRGHVFDALCVPLNANDTLNWGAAPRGALLCYSCFILDLSSLRCSFFNHYYRSVFQQLISCLRANRDIQIPREMKWPWQIASEYGALHDFPIWERNFFVQTSRTRPEMKERRAHFKIMRLEMTDILNLKTY